MTWVIASHVHLDDPSTLPLLSTLLGGFSAARSLPSALVLMGDFMSTPYGSRPGDRARYMGLMSSLADTLSSFPALAASCHIIIVPGPHDPGAPGVVPHLPLLSILAAPLLDKARFPRCTLATSPVRLSYYTKEASSEW